MAQTARGHQATEAATVRNRARRFLATCREYRRMRIVQPTAQKQAETKFISNLEIAFIQRVILSGKSHLLNDSGRDIATRYNLWIASKAA